MKLLLPLCLFLAILPFSKEIDLSLASKFYNSDSKTFVDNALTRFIYDFGEWPGFVTGGLAFIVFVLSFFLEKFKKWRIAAWILGLTLFLGSGMIVNVVLKEFVERPRPRQIEEFGGKYEFRPVYKPHFITKQKPDGQKSFPSGHVTMGFYFLSFFFIGKLYKNRFLIYFGVIFTCFWGGALCLGRMAQGAHFFTDTVVAALIMYYVALFMSSLKWNKVLLLQKKERRDHTFQ